VVLLIGLLRTSIVNLGVGDRADLVVAGVVSVAVMSTAFTSLAIGTAFDRRAEALALLGTTPLTRGEWMTARIAAVCLVEAVQLAVLLGGAIALGWEPDGIPTIIGLVLLGTAAFGALGLLLGGRVRAEAVLAIANGVFLLLLAAGGTIIAADQLPGPLATLVGLLPSGALGNALRETTTGGTPLLGDVLVLIGWTLGAGLVTARVFRWRSS